MTGHGVMKRKRPCFPREAADGDNEREWRRGENEETRFPGHAKCHDSPWSASSNIDPLCIFSQSFFCNPFFAILLCSRSGALYVSR